MAVVSKHLLLVTNHASLRDFQVDVGGVDIIVSASSSV